MAAKEFAEFKYESGVRSTNGIAFFLLAAMALAIGITAMNVEPLLLLLLVVPLILAVILRRRPSPNVIYIGGRYLVVGNSVIYYRNVEKATLDKQSHILAIRTGEGRSVEIRADKFPTNARKADKIAKNCNAKFDKAADKIMARLKEIVPAAVQ